MLFTPAWLSIEDEGRTTLHILYNHSLNDAVSHPTRTQSWTTPLWEPEKFAYVPLLVAYIARRQDFVVSVWQNMRLVKFGRRY